MSNDFLSPPDNFRPGMHVTSPYMKARAEWDNRLGHTTVQARNWRTAFFFIAFISCGLLGMCAFQISQRKLVPVVVTVNSENGAPSVIGKVGETVYEPKDQEIKYFLSQFIQKVRAVPADQVLIKKNWLEAYKFLRRSASVSLNAMINEDPESPFKKIGEQTVTVQPISIIRVNNSASFQVRWTEAVYGKTGALEEQYTMTGVFTTEVSPPLDEETVLTNPLGIFISTFQWSKEL